VSEHTFDKIGIAVVTTLVWAFIFSVMMNYKERQAVAHHAAEYYLDSNFNRQFRWLDEKK